MDAAELDQIAERLFAAFVAQMATASDRQYPSSPRRAWRRAQR